MLFGLDRLNYSRGHDDRSNIKNLKFFIQLKSNRLSNYKNRNIKQEAILTFKTEKY